MSSGFTEPRMSFTCASVTSSFFMISVIGQ
jgi:hypothetical protein